MSDWIDRATAAGEQYQEDALDEHRRRRAAQSRESRTLCEECGDEIPEKRRAAIRGCKRCLDCQVNFEKGE